MPKKQIELLLDKYFSTSGIARYRSEGYEYFKVDDVGVLVICERATDVYLDKLYLLPSARGKGYASFVFDELLSVARILRSTSTKTMRAPLRATRKTVLPWTSRWKFRSAATWSTTITSCEKRQNNLFFNENTPFFGQL